VFNIYNRGVAPINSRARFGLSGGQPMVSYKKPKHGSTGKTKKPFCESKTKTGPATGIRVPHHAAQSHDQPENFNMNCAKPTFQPFPRECHHHTG
jgi:hypothetical protein